MRMEPGKDQAPWISQVSRGPSTAHIRLSRGPHSPVVGSGADQLCLLIVLVDSISPLLGSVPVLLSQFPLSLNLLLPQLRIVTGGGKQSRVRSDLFTALRPLRPHTYPFCSQFLPQKHTRAPWDTIALEEAAVLRPAKEEPCSPFQGEGVQCSPCRHASKHTVISAMSHHCPALPHTHRASPASSGGETSAPSDCCPPTAVPTSHDSSSA